MQLNLAFAIKFGAMASIATVVYNLCLYLMQTIISIPIALYASYKLKKDIKESGLPFLNPSKRKDH